MDGSTRKTVVAVSIGALAIILLLFAWKIAPVLLLAFTGILLGVLLRGIAKFLSSNTGLSTQSSLWIVLGASILLVTLAAIFIGPRIAEQIDHVAEVLPGIIEQARRQLGKYGWGRLIIEQARALMDGQEWVVGAKAVLLALVGGVTGMLVVLFVGIYTAIAPHSYHDSAISLVPKRHRRKAREIQDRLVEQMQRWLIGRLIAMVSVGIMTFTGLLVLDVPLALTLAVFAGMLDFIPNIGPLLAAVPATLFALAISPQLAIYVIILYTIIQLIENYVVTPVVERRAVKLPPAFVVVFQLAMGYVFGFLGLLVATPLAVVIIVLVRSLYVEKI